MEIANRERGRENEREREREGERTRERENERGRENERERENERGRERERTRDRDRKRGRKRERLGQMFFFLGRQEGLGWARNRISVWTQKISRQMFVGCETPVV